MILAIPFLLSLHAVGIGLLLVQTRNQKLILMKLSQLQSEFEAVNTQLSKIQSEIGTATAGLNQRIDELEEIINNSSDPEIPAAAAQAFVALRAQVDQLDALNPDGTTDGGGVTDGGEQPGNSEPSQV